MPAVMSPLLELRLAEDSEDMTWISEPVPGVFSFSILAGAAVGFEVVETSMGVTLFLGWTRVLTFSSFPLAVAAGAFDPIAAAVDKMQSFLCAGWNCMFIIY